MEQILHGSDERIFGCLKHALFEAILFQPFPGFLKKLDAHTEFFSFRIVNEQEEE